MIVALVLALTSLTPACNRGGEDSATTTGVTTASGGAATSRVTTTTAGATEPVESSSASTTAVIAGMPVYEVVEATPGSTGDALIVVVEPGAYSNVQLENLAYEIVDRFAPASAIVVDGQEAADLLLLTELDDTQQGFLAAHTVLEIRDGIEVTFLGPYTDIPGLTVGS